MKYKIVRIPGGHPYVVVFDLESIAGHRKHNFKAWTTGIGE